MQGGEQYRSLLADLLWGRAQDIITAKEKEGALTLSLGVSKYYNFQISL